MTQIIAHRGASKIAPENTMPAFKLAYQLGAEGIETDIHLTKDQIPILMHDERVERTTNGIGHVVDFTFQQLKELDAGSWFSSLFSRTSIVSLKEFLTWAQCKPLYLNIELKNNKIDYKHLESIVFEMIMNFRLQERTTLSTFNPDSIKRMNMYNDQINIALLTSRRKRNLCTYAKQIGAHALHIKYRLLHQNLVRQCQEKKMPLRVFTINKTTHMMRCYQLRCDGIFTDLPEKGIRYRELFAHQNNTIKSEENDDNYFR